ncbi:hypothetical protein [Kineococcus sp. SYSU DK001]
MASQLVLLVVALQLESVAGTVLGGAERPLTLCRACLDPWRTTSADPSR